MIGHSFRRRCWTTPSEWSLLHAGAVEGNDFCARQNFRSQQPRIDTHAGVRLVEGRPVRQAAADRAVMKFDMPVAALIDGHVSRHAHGVGPGAIRAFGHDSGCEVIAVSRRPPEGVGNVRFVAADLFDERSCREIFAQFIGVTHLVFTALYEKEGGLLASWLDPEQIARNAAMLRNLFEPLSRAAKNLRHVTLLQGTKAYGAHVRALSVPAREDRDELKSQPNFYWNQEDYLRAKQQGAAWSFSIIR